MSVVALQQPHKLRDLLAYSTIIVKEANDYEGIAYVHFRTLAASRHGAEWAKHYGPSTSTEQERTGRAVMPSQLALIIRHLRWG